MRQIVNVKDGGYDALEIHEVERPEPKSDELLIKVKASGINFADILARKGIYPDAPPKPCVVGYEVSGTVTEVGEEIDDAWLDREVIALCRFKGQAEYVVVKQHQVYEKPEKLTFEQAAAIPVNYLTAYVLIVVMGSLQPYESILIHNVGGGVGLASLDIAKKIGATTYGTASKRKHQFLEERGLDHAIDYRSLDWKEELMKMTGSRGVDLVIDPLGGKEWKRSYESLRATGRLGMFGISSASNRSGIFAKLGLVKLLLQTPIFHPLPLIDKNRGVFGVNLGHLWHEPKKAEHWMAALAEGVEEGWINPHVDKTFTFAEVAEAHRYIEERKNIGKVILVP